MEDRRVRYIVFRDPFYVGWNQRGQDVIMNATIPEVNQSHQRRVRLGSKSYDGLDAMLTTHKRCRLIWRE